MSTYTFDTPADLIYYTSNQMLTFSSNIASYMKIKSPYENICTYSSCTITPDTGTSYLSIVDNTIDACKKPNPVTSPDC